MTPKTTDEELKEKILKEVLDLKYNKFLKKDIDKKIGNMKSAEKEYKKEQEVIYNSLKKQFKINDEQFQDSFDCGEPEELIDSWTDALDKLQSELEKKYDIFEIEQDEETLIMTSFNSGWMIKYIDGEIEITNDYVEQAISLALSEKNKEIEELKNSYEPLNLKDVEDLAELLLKQKTKQEIGNERYRS